MTHRNHFPIYTTHPDLVYLDSGATTLKPQSVIDAELGYYREYSANIHRGLYPISLQATQGYDRARAKVASFINAPSPVQVVFTRGTTDGLNLLASSLAHDLKTGDEIVCTILEHHSNFVPWQQLALRQKLYFTVWTELSLERMSDYISPRVKILTLSLISNVTGEILPLRQIIAAARKINPSLIVIVDAAQAVAHMSIDVQELDCDYLVFSGHKLYGPTGIGVLYGKKARLEALPPYQYGGDMIHSVAIEKTTFANVPARLEAGTPPIAQAIGLCAAVDFVLDIGWDEIKAHESELYRYTRDKLLTLGDRIRLVRPVLSPQSGDTIITFTSPVVHPHDLADLLGQQQICIRAGHHCAQPLHEYAGIAATARMSFGIYNTKEDVDLTISQMVTILESFGS